jgi:predicted nucleic acid-binding protein
MAEALIDTHILLNVHTQDPIWEARSAGAVADSATLVINPIIYAELSIGFEGIEVLDEFLGTDFRRDPLPWEAAFLAGKAFLTYRRRGGKKTAPLPAFYIGAHAAVKKMKILTRDPNRYSSYFPAVEILEP